MRRATAILLLLMGAFMHAIGQGCSDPGICTIGTLNSSATKDTVSSVNFVDASMEALLSSNIVDEKLKVGFESVYAMGEKGTNIYNLVLRSSCRVTEKMLLNVKVPYTFTSGVLGSANGPGDITLSLQNTFISGNNKRVAYTLGVVLPPNNSNLQSNGFSLPMAYQTSLGAFNALAGLSFAYKGWAAVVGYQHSFGANGNEFTRENLTVNDTLPGYDPLNIERRGYYSSRQLKRGSDVIARLEKRIRIKKLSLLGGVLPIYRLQNSTYRMLDGTEEEIKGSNGLTLNLTAGASYSIKDNWRILANFGSPVIQRSARPDGLTRKFVFIVGVTYRKW